MGKIIKKSVEHITLKKKKFSLGMKGEFKIEFASDSFGPYRYKFDRVDCYFNDGLDDRGTKIFPLKNKEFKNTEIFLEINDIVIAVGERGSLLGGEKSFIDIINIKSEKKYRLFTDEVNLIYNTKDSIILNTKYKGIFKTLTLDMTSMEKIEEKEEEVLAFFKCIYNKKEKLWYRLNFIVGDEEEKDEEKKYQNGYFNLVKLGEYSEPKIFKRVTFNVILSDEKSLDIWKKSFNEEK